MLPKALKTVKAWPGGKFIPAVAYIVQNHRRRVNPSDRQSRKGWMTNGSTENRPAGPIVTWLQSARLACLSPSSHCWLVFPPKGRAIGCTGSI